MVGYLYLSKTNMTQMKQNPTEDPDPSKNSGKRPFLRQRDPHKAVGRPHQGARNPVPETSQLFCDNLQNTNWMNLQLGLSNDTWRKLHITKENKELWRHCTWLPINVDGSGAQSVRKHKISLKHRCVTQPRGGAELCRTAPVLECGRVSAHGRLSEWPERHQAAGWDTQAPRPTCRNPNTLCPGQDVKTRALQFPGWF